MNNNIVFLLGAGASVKAGVPATYSFVSEFVSSLEGNAKEVVVEIIDILRKWKKDEIDIELLLETMVKLNTKENEPLIQFYEGSNFKIKDISLIDILITRLKDFIKFKSIVKEADILYYQPLLDFINEYKSQDIITLNYDICLEQFCNIHRIEYTDGFDVYWDADKFVKDNYIVRIYKLHGSVMWYQTETGRYLKLPVMTNESKVDLITGEKAVNLMMYPMQKMDYPEPLLELLVITKKLLITKCKILVIVGYSFRDDPIKRLLFDAASKNPDLHIILIDKNAQNIYKNKLKYYDADHKIPSPLNGKVLCLPYKFEEIFPYLKNYYIKNLNECITEEAKCINSEIKGIDCDWFNVQKLAAAAEFVEKIGKTENKLNMLNKADLLSLADIEFKRAINTLANMDVDLGSKYMKEYCKLLREVIQLYPNISATNQLNVNFVVDYHKYVSSSSHKEIITLESFIMTHINYANQRLDKMFETNENIKNVIQLLIKIHTEITKYNRPKEIIWYLALLRTQIPSLDHIVNITKEGILQISDFDLLNNLISNYENEKIDNIFVKHGYKFGEEI